MPNHIHALIGFHNSSKSINRIVGEGKRFMAYEIVKRLKEKRATALLTQLQKGVEEKDRQRNKQHEVWCDSFDWKECRGQAFINHKLQYIHLNSCTGKWNLAQSPIAYPHSSAGFYATGALEHAFLTHVDVLQDVDLTREEC